MGMKKWVSLLSIFLAILFAPRFVRGLEIVSDGPFHSMPLPLLSPEGRVLNVATVDFGRHIGGGDYGRANIEPVEVRTGLDGGQQISIFRTPSRLRLSRRGTASFQVKLGETRHIYCWLESPPVGGSWHVTATATYDDGAKEVLVDEDFLRDGEYFVWTPPRSVINFRVSSKEKKRELCKRFTFTVSPVSITSFKGVRPVPYTIDKHVTDW